MSEFTVNAARHDPYKGFKFRVRWDGKIVAGVSRISALRRTTEVVTHRDGGDPSLGRKSPGASKYEAVTLERGVTHDTAFEQWANLAWDLGAGPGFEVKLREFRKNVAIELLNEAGQIVIAYTLFRCWPSTYEALGDLDAAASGTAIQRLILENEGWARDLAVTEPTEP